MTPERLEDQCRERLADPTWTFMPFHRDVLAELLAALDAANTDAARLAESLAISDVCGPRPGIGLLRDESRAALAAHRARIEAQP